MGTEAQRIAVGGRYTAGRMRRSQYAVLLAVFLVSSAVGYAAYQRFFASASPAAPLQTAAVRRGSIAATVSAAGSVVPNKQSKLTFATSGTLQEINVGLGDRVKAGQVLARLDTTPLEIKLAQAKSSLRSAQIKLDQLKAGATADEITAAKAALAAAEAKYNEIVRGPTEADLKAAEQSVANAQANLIKAQAELAKLKAGPSQDEITVAKADLEKKQAALQKAQADYDRVAWRGDIIARPEAVALQQATTDYQSALASYNIKIAPPKPEDLAAGEKAVETAAAALASAQAKLDELKAGPKAADVQSAQSNVASARAQLALKSGQASEHDLATAQEQVTSAELSVRQAEADLAKASLIAPFDGVVAAVALNVGEQTSGTSTITIVDPNSVRVDVTVDESDVSKLSLGKTAQVAFDALPDTRLPAKVVGISPSANVQQGVVTYLVSLNLEVEGVYLPAGMTANATITVDQRDNVLLVPNRAVRTQGRNRVVEVLANGKPETRTVTIGMSNDQFTEVTSGLQENEQVIIPTTTTTSPARVPGMGGFGGPPGGPVFITK